MEGSVYVLTNPAMPNMVKIGKTTRDVELRLADLYSTGVPLPFECEYAAAYSHSNGRGTPVEYRSASLSSTSLVVLPIFTMFGIAGLVRT